MQLPAARRIVGLQMVGASEKPHFQDARLNASTGRSTWGCWLRLTLWSASRRSFVRLLTASNADTAALSPAARELRACAAGLLPFFPASLCVVARWAVGAPLG